MTLAKDPSQARALSEKMHKNYDGLHAQFWNELGSRYRMFNLPGDRVGISVEAAPDPKDPDSLRSVDIILDQRSALEMMAGLRSIFQEQGLGLH